MSTYISLPEQADNHVITGLVVGKRSILISKIIHRPALCGDDGAAGGGGGEDLFNGIYSREINGIHLVNRKFRSTSSRGAVSFLMFYLSVRIAIPKIYALRPGQIPGRSG